MTARIVRASLFSVVLLVAARVRADEAPAPMVSMESLMNLRFYEQKGGFIVEALQIAFPQNDTAKGRVTLSRDGKVVAETPVRVEKHYAFPAFGALRPGEANPAGMFDAPGPGKYVMTAELDGKSIGAYAFTLEEVKSKDPFKPGSVWTRKGPWSKTAILRNAIEAPHEAIRVGVWLNKTDLPGYQKNVQTPIRVSLSKGGKEVAYVEGAANDEEWTYYNYQLQQGTRQQHGPYRWTDLVKGDGAFSLRVLVKNAVAKEWKFKVHGGTVVRIPSNVLGYKGDDALCPQGISSNNGTLQREEQFWLAPVR